MNKATLNNRNESESIFQKSVSQNIKLLTAKIHGNSTLSSSMHGNSDSQCNQYISEYMQLYKTHNEMKSYNSEPFITTNTLPDTVLINPSAIYNLRYEFEHLRDRFLDEAQAKSIKLSLSFASDNSTAYWDIACLHRHVFNSILSNMLRCTATGGQIVISVKKSDNYNMIITISNSGSCATFAENKNEFCNDPNSCKKISDDSGLKMAQLYVQAHKGTLNIINTPENSGHGFEIAMPLYKLCFQ